MAYLEGYDRVQTAALAQSTANAQRKAKSMQRNAEQEGPDGSTQTTDAEDDSGEEDDNEEE